MNLEYRVLWFDDQEDNNKGIEDNLRTRLAREGFTLKVKKVSSFKEDVSGQLRQLNQLEEWDLILIDWDLGNASDGAGGKLDGAKLAKKVRVHFPYTDLVFYSAETPKRLRELVFQEDVDGVRCAERGNHLKAATWGVVQTGIRKVLDLNHMRGIVMAAVADLDQEIEQCLVALHDRLPAERRSELAASIVKRIGDVADTNRKQIEKLVDKSFAELLDHRSFSSGLKHLVLHEAVKQIAEEAAATMIVDRLGSYGKEVIDPRNAFGHVKAERINGKLVLKGRDIAIDRDAMATIRRQLLEHRDNLEDLLELLRKWQATGVSEKVNEKLDAEKQKDSA